MEIPPYSQDERDELARLMTTARRYRPQDIDRLREAAVEAIAAEKRLKMRDQAGEPDGELALLTARFNSCRAVHRYVHAQPYHDDLDKARSSQWQVVLARFSSLGDHELTEWLALQVEVATNIERGLPDHRPRKDGPTFLILLEFVANQKRKALAILHWFKGVQGGH